MIDLVIKFNRFIKISREIEKEIIAGINACFPEIDCSSVSAAKDKDYFAGNYLSVLFLFIYDHLKISKQTVFFLGTLNYVIRGLVTYTDDLLDEEHKYLFVSQKIDRRANKPQAIMGLMVLQHMFDVFLDQAVQNEMISPEAKSQIKTKIYAALFAIGIIEAQEESKNGVFLAPEDILRKVNFYRGSKLLELAFIPLSIIQPDKEDQIVINGVHDIGMGLQIFDDISDVSIDLITGKRNYLLSVIQDKYSRGTKELLNEMRDEKFYGKYDAEFRDCFKQAVLTVKAGLKKVEGDKIMLKQEYFRELMTFMLKNRKMEAYISMLKEVF